MALFKPFRGTRALLDTQSLHDGYAYFCTDDGTFHIDYIDADGNLQRKQINENYIKQLNGVVFLSTLSIFEAVCPTLALGYNLSLSVIAIQKCCFI